MHATLKRLRDRDDEGGFTLIEVMVVVLIIGILLAIGVPTFLGARTRAQDRAAQTSLRTAQTAAMVIFTDNSDIGEADTDALGASEPALTWLNKNHASTEPNEVTINPVDENNWYAAAMSASGTCFVIHINTQSAVSYGQTTGECKGSQAVSPTTNTW